MALLHSVFQSLTGAKSGNHGFGDFNDFFGLGIVPLAGGTLLHFEGAKAHDLGDAAELRQEKRGVAVRR